jgi:hypothetical protein
MPGASGSGHSGISCKQQPKNLESREVLPQATRMSVLWNPTTPSQVPGRQAVKVAGQRLGFALEIAPAATAEVKRLRGLSIAAIGIEPSGGFARETQTIPIVIRSAVASPRASRIRVATSPASRTSSRRWAANGSNC